MSDVVVVLPGILGSALRKDGEDIWALSLGAALPGLLSLGRRLNRLALGEDSLEPDLGDGVEAVGLMPDVHMIPGFWKIDGYSRLKQHIRTVFEVEEGENYFEFAYDWRRDLRVAASKLQQDSHEWLSRRRAAPGNENAKLILVAHSMGGLVARYFLEVLEGWSDTKVLYTIGTPYRGSLNPLRTLVEGVRKGPFGLVNLTSFARSLTSVYQLLPIYPSYDAGEGGLVRVGETRDIPNVDAQKAADALAFHREIMGAAERHRMRSDYLENGYRVYPIIGIAQPTLQSAVRAGDGPVEFLGTHGGEDRRGDGTVPRVSGTPPEFDVPRDEMYESTRHGSLQNADPVLNHLTGV